MSNLKVEIAALKLELDQSTPEEVGKLLNRAVQWVSESGIAESALGVDDYFPQFSLPNVVGESISSAELLAEGPLVVCFYRGAWCPYCNLELHAYQGIIRDIHELGAELVAISPQLPDESMIMAAKANLTFEILNDIGNSMSEHIGLVHELRPSVVDLYRSMGYDLERINGNVLWSLPLPATYVIDRDHRIHMAFINADYRVRLEPDQVLVALRELA
jgi:peroxiredoxin